MHFLGALLLASLLFTSIYADSTCGDWEPYKDEKCIKVIDETHTYDDAVKLCHSKEAGSTLISINSAEEQTFMENLLFKTHKVVDAVWLGARLVSNKFKWTDDTEVKYTNWATGSPSNSPDLCVQMIPEKASQGKWINEPCNKKNVVVCQKSQTWSIAKLQQTLLDTRKQLEKTQIKLSELKINNPAVPIPIGFIYVQLPKEPEPKTLWPTMEWKNVSSEYAGLFFRADGGDAATFGSVQEGNAPRITKVSWNGPSSSCGDIDLPVGGWSSYVVSGKSETPSICHRFLTSGGEVRPRNMAMRIWKRVK